MDHQSGFDPRQLRTQIDPANERLLRYIHLLCLAKGLQPRNESPADADHDITVHDADFPVTGVVNASDYLDERFPFPPMMPAGAKLRALTRMTIEQALQANPGQLEQALPGDGFLFSRSAPTAGDLAIAAALPHSIFARRVLAALQRLAPESDAA